VAILAEADGTPALIALDATWTQDVDGAPTPASVALEYAIDELGRPDPIAAPAEPWTRHLSEVFEYAMAYPPAWTVETAEAEEAFVLDGQPFVYVTNVALEPAVDLAEYAATLRDEYDAEFGTAPDEAAPTTLDGLPAERLVYRVENDAGDEVLFVDTVAVRDGVGWEVFLVTLGGPGAGRDAELYDDFLATFAFGG
jgi:hypothetical protein